MNLLEVSKAALLRSFPPVLLVIGFLYIPSLAKAEDSDNGRTYLHLGSYAHYKEKDEYTDDRYLVALERHRDDDWFYGLSLFNNSFGQFSQYLYAGKTFRLDEGGLQNWNVKLSAGLIHGYYGKYKDVLPITDGDFSLGVIPTIGYKRPDNRWGVDLSFLGASGVLLTVGSDLEF